MILEREHRTEQSIRSGQKALENKRFTVARGQIHKYFDLQEIREARFPTQAENYRFQTALSQPLLGSSRNASPPLTAVSGGEALRDDPNNGCEGD